MQWDSVWSSSKSLTYFYVNQYRLLKTIHAEREIIKRIHVGRPSLDSETLITVKEIPQTPMYSKMSGTKNRLHFRIFPQIKSDSSV